MITITVTQDYIYEGDYKNWNPRPLDTYSVEVRFDLFDGKPENLLTDAEYMGGIFTYKVGTYKSFPMACNNANRYSEALAESLHEMALTKMGK